MNPGRGLVRARVERIQSTPIRSKDGLIARVLYGPAVDLGSLGVAMVKAAREEAKK